ESRVTGNCHARFGAGEKAEITSKPYLSLSYEMVASAMESKRLGLCTKNLIVVPKHIVNQTAKEFLQLYPAANILVPNENDFTAKNRQKFCSRISTGNYDAIIISHNQFEKIPLSVDRQITFIEEEIDEITKNLEMLKNQRGERGYTVKDLERTRKNLENTLETLNNNKKRDTVVTFEELGVDKLYVDEVQSFKNLFLVSKMGRNVAGINTSSRSQRATDLYMKCQYLDEKTGSKGTVFATGTPLSNSMTELYTMQKYLQQDELKARGLNNFDSWASCFGETQTALELAPEGKGYQMKTRFSRFFNLPELMSFFKETADIKVADELNLPVPKANFHNIATEPSRFQQDMVSDLAVRAKRIRDRQVRPEEDNMLKVTNEGRKLALDQRIANPLLPDDPGSKVNACIDNVFDIWKNTAEERSTQLIFCDLSTPGGTGFNVYNDIKSKLIDKGVPSEEIAFIHDCKTDKQKQELFTKVNNGEVRVLLGSTSKMGTGTNCQQRLKALHHIDCPYRPSDLEQRNGRIIRQGNTNKEVDIYSYVTKGTFDSYIYQLLENKQKFISQIMTSKSPVRSAEDVDKTVLSYSQIKALAAGDPKIKEKMDLDIDLARLRTLFADYQSTKRHLQNDILNKYPADIKQLEQHIVGLEKDIVLGELTKDKEFDGITIYDKKYTDKKEAGTALISACQMFPTDAKSREIGEYRGFKAILSFDSFTKGFNLTLKNATSITVPLGQDPYGNFTRLNNAISNFPKELETHKAALENTMKNLKNAKEELSKPFARIDELHEKERRLAELNKELTMSNIADNDNTKAEQESKTEEAKSKPVKDEYVAAL
ncbi:MAG: helicase, partial [Clostridiales bacterium]|nr:helicase [Clostridiales bacterium]